MNNYIIRPFGRFVTGHSSSQKIDAFYILSMKGRPVPTTSFSLLKRYCNEIVFLFSDYIPYWYDDLRIRYKCVRHVQLRRHDYCLEYLSKPENNNISVMWRPDFDIPIKRSFAINESIKLKYKYIGMIDDDIFLEDYHLINAIYALESGNYIVGFHIDYYPDKSSLEHVERELTGICGLISITGSAMFLDVEKIQGDFPLVYNEDVLFFLQQNDLSKVVSGGVLHQNEYRTWKGGARVKHEQFGEIIYNALKNKLTSVDKSLILWDEEIDAVKNKVQQLMYMDKNHTYSSLLKNAMEALSLITKNDILSFLNNCSFPTTITNLYEV